MKCRNCKNNGFLTDENGTQYSWCEVACDNLDVDEERRCAAFVKATNADRIRAMTDEELEDWYWWMHKEMMYYTDSHAFVHNWLKEEVDDE